MADLLHHGLTFKVKKILKAKSWVGLDNYTPVHLENLTEDLNSYTSQVINCALAEHSVTLLKNDKKLIPLNSKNLKIALVSLLPTPENQLFKMVSNYGEVKHFEIPKQKLDTIQTASIISELKGYDVVIAAPFLTQVRPTQKYGLSEKLITILDSIGMLPASVLLWLGNPYGLEKSISIIILPYLPDTRKRISPKGFWHRPFLEVYPFPENYLLVFILYCRWTQEL
ncbi:MAG: hypothetical protein IPF52_02485 [Saprospiraceae bacterium]|nr:hypothetical protein [Saprospiraceae bacterium]